jgi:adenine-specific DNA-methyltransferase
MSMEQVIREKKVLWPKDDKVVTYASLEEMLTAIDAGKAPRHIRRGLPDLDFWVGRPIGYGMPRYKMHKSELDATHNPLSTWLASHGDKEESAEGTDTGTVEVGSTAEGASLLTAMLGTKDFPYPKPLSLTQALVQQATRPGDIIVDFFAGSGTTGHAVLAVNEEDGGDRRFILVSSTEATEKMPDRNVCRDICQRRIEKAIGGYNYTTKKGLKEVPGLGGNVAYLRCKRLPPGRLTEIDHAQVWTALQLVHCAMLSAFRDGAILRAGDEDQLLIYLPRFRRADAGALRRAVKESRSVIVYSWQPEVVRQQLHSEAHVQVEPVPESLARRFGMKV